MLVLIVVGVALVGGFVLIHLFDNILDDFFMDYVYDTTDPYWLGSQLVWDSIKYVILILGVILLYTGAKKSTTNIGGGQ